MGITQLKNVNWAADQRLDVDDMNAMAALKDADLKELFETFLMEPSQYGCVLRGFNGVAGTGLTWDFAAEDSAAIASDGAILEKLLSDGVIQVTLSASLTNYVHAYTLDVTSDSDNRRFINDLVTPPEEYTLNTATRTSKKVAFYVTTNSDATPLLASFQTSAFLSGATRQLVPIVGIKTSGVGVSSFIDFRNTLLPGGNPNAAPAELPVAVGTSTVTGIRSAIRALASVIRELGSDPASQQWWNTAYSRTDPLNTTVKTSLRDRIASSRGEFCTVHPTADRGDYQTLPAALAATSSGEIRLKAGVHAAAATAALTGKSNLTITGEGYKSTILRLGDNTGVATAGLVFGASTSDITFRGLSIVCDTLTLNGPVLDFTATTVSDIVFENCRFYHDLATCLLRTVANGAKNVKFINCRFELAYTSMFDVSGWQPSTETLFENCYFVPTTTDGNLANNGVQTGGILKTKFSNCQFGDRTLVFTWQGFGNLYYQNSTLLTWECLFENCDFFGMESFLNVARQSQLFFAEFTFKTCRFDSATVLPTTAMFKMTATSLTWSPSAKVVWYDSVVNHYQVFACASAGCQPPGIQAFNTRFQTTFAASGAAQSLFYFVSTSNTTSHQFRFVGCQFFHNSASAFSWDIDVAGTSQNAWFFNGCEFYTSPRPRTSLTTSAVPQIFLRHNGSGAGSRLEVHVLECLFQNAHASQLPMTMDAVAGAGTANGLFRYSWQNGTAGTVNDTGITFTTGGWRNSDTPFRMTTGTRIPA